MRSGRGRPAAPTRPHVPPRHKAVILSVQGVMQLMGRIALEDTIEQRVVVHYGKGVDAVERAVVAREQHANVPVDANGQAKEELRGK